MNKSKIGHEKALWAVDRARDVLQKMGYVVGIPGHVCQNGADLIVTRGPGAKYSVEVKLVMWNKRAWRVNRVTRRTDDFIALVFPSGYVHLDEMKNHLSLCNGAGDRYVTKLGRFFE